MKQGRATHEGMMGGKREPQAHAINPQAVEDLGDAVQFVKPNLKDGRGYMAPKNANETTHKGGSQGRH